MESGLLQHHVGSPTLDPQNEVWTPWFCIDCPVLRARRLEVDSIDLRKLESFESPVTRYGLRGRNSKLLGIPGT